MNLMMNLASSIHFPQVSECFRGNGASGRENRQAFCDWRSPSMAWSRLGANSLNDLAG